MTTLTTDTGLTFALLDDPQLDNYQSGVAYKAKALDQDGDEVTLVWDCTDWFNSDTDEEFDCDWANDAVAA